MKEFNEFITESGLSRVYQHSKEHSIGTITAFRDANSTSTNKKLNKGLKTRLLALGYGVTAVKGSYIENHGQDNAVEVDEDVFLVVDLKDGNKLKENLIKLGKKYDQDSILFINQGSNSGVLIGTNDTGYPGLGKQMILKRALFGEKGEFYTKVNGRPFTLKEEVLFEEVPPTGWHGKYALSQLAKELDK